MKKVTMVVYTRGRNSSHRQNECKQRTYAENICREYMQRIGFSAYTCVGFCTCGMISLKRGVRFGTGEQVESNWRQPGSSDCALEIECKARCYNPKSPRQEQEFQLRPGEQKSAI
jgi:hypothetical protein